MSSLQRWSFRSPVSDISREPTTSFVKQSTKPTDPRSGSLRFELAALLLLVATFAAILFRDAIVSRQFSLNPATISQYSHYWYADDSAGGKSTATVNQAEPVRWTCDLRPGFSNPYCGWGILLDGGHTGAGRDLSGFQKVRIQLDYRGPARLLKIMFKNAAPHTAPDGKKPNAIQFPVRPGPNDIRLDLNDAAVEQWWVDTNRALPDAGRPDLRNIVGIDIGTGRDDAIGHHMFALRAIELSGNTITAEHWYLVLLGAWIGLIALYLVFRVVRMRRAYAARQHRMLEESRLLQDARDAAESASHAKSRFLAHMSHELRTPLNAILGYAQILDGGALNERQAVAARTIQQSGEHLLSLITDILDHSKIEAGKLELTPGPIELRAMVRGVADMIALRAHEKDVAFHWTVEPDVPRGIVGDEKCLRQVLINLLGNAVKFTTCGDVRLQVALLSARGGDVRLRFDVRDTGSGIATDQLETIFEPFEQAGERARRAGGTGLGLSISRRIVALMNGRIHVASTLGVGSRFWFDVTFPLADNAALPAATAGEESGSASARPRRETFSALPPPECMERLHDLAKAGNMRAIRVEADRLIESDAAIGAFADELRALACSYQSQAILELIEKNKAESVTV